MNGANGGNRNTHALCELRVLGENDAVLRTISDQLPLGFGANGSLPSRCAAP